MNTSFKIGDIVKVNGGAGSIIFKGEVGVITREVGNNYIGYDYAVKFSEKFHSDLHSDNGRDGDRRTYLVYRKNVTFFQKGKRTSGFGRFINEKKL